MSTLIGLAALPLAISGSMERPSRDTHTLLAPNQEARSSLTPWTVPKSPSGQQLPLLLWQARTFRKLRAWWATYNLSTVAEQYTYACRPTAALAT